jgi:murein DD-endopeptidase MepM/ murein hydrolase activator NlpD
LLALLVLGLVACAPPRPSWVRPDEPGREAGSGAAPPIELRGEGKSGERVHVVRAGETLYRIALLHGVDPDELADLNQISDPKRLGVGRELVLPAPKGRRVASLDRAPAGPKTVAAAPAKRPRPPATIDAGPRPDRALAWPLEGVLFGRFGVRDGTPHDGIDLAAPEGTPIRAAAGGVVLYAGTQRGYGNLVILRHEDGLITIYAHNQKNLVREGDRVRTGEEVGLVGRTGRATGPHCHFEVRQGTKPRDPLLFLR